MHAAHSSALCVVWLARPLFGDPLMADASEVDVFTAPEPCRQESETRDRDGYSEDDPGAVHRRCPLSGGAIANNVIGSV
jgi:hypothetical protein